MIKCDICNKEFEKKRSLSNHRRWHAIGCGVFFTILIVVAFISGIFYMSGKSQLEDRSIVAEGPIEEMRIEPERGLGSQTWYFLTIKGKEVEVKEDWYYQVNIGDNVTVYLSGRVEVNG